MPFPPSSGASVPLRRPRELDELHLLFAARTRPVAAKRISILRVGFRPSTCSMLGFRMANRIAARATMSRKKIPHAVLLVAGNIAGRRVDRRNVRHIGILIISKIKQAQLATAMSRTYICITTSGPSVRLPTYSSFAEERVLPVASIMTGEHKMTRSSQQFATPKKSPRTYARKSPLPHWRKGESRFKARRYRFQPLCESPLSFL